jgi:hypothetical protein
MVITEPCFLSGDKAFLFDFETFGILLFLHHDK